MCFVLSTRGFVHGGLETVADHLAAGLVERGYPVAFVLGVAAGRARRADMPAGRVYQLPLLAHDTRLARWLGRALRWPPARVPRLSVTPLGMPAVRVPRLRVPALRVPPLHVQSLSFVAACLASRPARRVLLDADVRVTFLDGESVLLSRLGGRPSISYLAGAIDLGWARADRSTRRLATSRTVAEVYRRHGLACDGVLTPGISADLLEGPPAGSTSGQRLLYVGRLEPNKRVDRLLLVLDRLVQEFPLVSLRVVGDGPSRGQLEAAARRADLGSRVDFAGALPPNQVEHELRQADVFVFPSAYESFGTAPLEALAAGLPVVASDLPALREATGGHASLVVPDDLDGWVDAIRPLLMQPTLRASRVAAGRTWAAGFTWPRIVDQFERELQAALQAGGDATRA